MEISASPFTAISGLNTYRDQIGRPAQDKARVDQIGRLGQGDARVDQIGRPAQDKARVDQIGRPAQGYQTSATGVVTGITQWPFEATQELSVFG